MAFGPQASSTWSTRSPTTRRCAPTSTRCRAPGRPAREAGPHRRGAGRAERAAAMTRNGRERDLLLARAAAMSGGRDRLSVVERRPRRPAPSPVAPAPPAARPCARSAARRSARLAGASARAAARAPRSSRVGLAVVRVREVDAAAGIPGRALVPVCRHAPRVLQHAREVQQVPGEEGRVPVGEVVLGPAGSGVEVARARAGLAQPRRVGLRRDDEAQVLERVEDVRRRSAWRRPRCP